MRPIEWAFSAEPGATGVFDVRSRYGYVGLDISVLYHCGLVGVEQTGSGSHWKVTLTRTRHAVDPEVVRRVVQWLQSMGGSQKGRPRKVRRLLCNYCGEAFYTSVRKMYCSDACRDRATATAAAANARAMWARRKQQVSC